MGKAKGALKEALTALDKKTGELEGATQRAFFGLPPSGKPPENFSTLNQHFAAILGIADSTDAAPTTQATAVYLELRGALGELLARWKQVQQSDVATVNAALQKAGVPQLDLNKAASSPAENSEEDDTP
jgi:hypothetical protein